ncbi:MAG: hypothetical protein ACJ781_10635, partial [Myxococcales bacterium]
MTLLAAMDTGARNIESFGLWVGLLAAIVGVMVFDLRLAPRRDLPQRFGEAVVWSVFWITL